MIVFLDSKVLKDPKFLEEVDIENSYLFNLSGFMDKTTQLKLIPDASVVTAYNELQFDQQYASYILNNDAIFYEFFSKVINPIYMGRDVFIVVQRSEFFDAITESLLKLIQQRYGYNNIAIVNTVEDIDYIPRDNIFTTAGIYNLDIDKERYSAIYAYRNARCFNSDGTLNGNQEAEYV